MVPFADDVLVLPDLTPAGPRFTTEIGLSKGARDEEEALSLELPRGRPASRGKAFGVLVSGCEDLSVVASIRALFTAAGRSSSSAFRLGNVALGRGAGFGDGVGFSPVIDASKSRI